MITWIIVIGAIIFILLLLKLRHMKNRFTIIVIILLLIFFYISAAKIISSQNIDLKTGAGLKTATKLYVSWLGTVFHNVKTLAGEAIRMDWSVKNETSGAAKILDEFG